MTQTVHLSISYTSSQELLITARLGEEEVRAYAPLPTESEDLINELRGGRATQSALKQSREMITALLYAGGIRDLMQSALETSTGETLSNGSALKMIILLSTPPELCDWPWELALSPNSERALLLDGVELVRVVEDQLKPNTHEELTISSRGRVITKSSEMFKFSAMRAATAHITRRYQVEVEVAHDLEDASLKSPQRRLLTHLYAVDKRGLITLESSREPELVSESSIASESYLLNITPLISAREAVAVRRAGALAVITRQFEQSVKLRAESDRALYHGLGSGFTLAQAVQWARQALARSEDKRDSGYQWASLTLTTAMLAEREPIALMPFPPNFKRQDEVTAAAEVSAPQDSQSVAVDATPEAPTTSELREGRLITINERRSLPLSGERFVLSTVGLIQKSQQSGDATDKIALALRTPVMRHLSGIVQKSGLKPNPKLSRSAQLSSQLIEASLRADQPLTLPVQWLGRAERIAESLGLRIDPVAQAVRALITSPAIWVCGADAQTRLTFARALCEEAFQTFPHEPLSADVYLGASSNGAGAIRGSAEDMETEALSPNLTQRVYVGLATAATLSSSGREELSRQLCIGYQPEREAWRVYERAWTIIDQADTVNARHRNRAGLAIRQGQLGGYVTHHAETPAASDTRREVAVVTIPQDARLIYLSDAPPHTVDESEVIINLEPDVTLLPGLWLNRLQGDLSARALDEVMILDRVNHPLTESLSATLALAVLVGVISVTRAYDALCYATSTGVNEATCTEALELYLDAQLSDPAAHDCVVGFGTLEATRYERGWRAIFGDATPLSLPRARVLIDLA